MQSETIGAIAAALAKAQGAIKPANFDKAAKIFGNSEYKYATLTSLWESARAALSANGLSVVQTTDFNDGGEIVLISTLMHSSGEWIGSVYPVRAKDSTPQALGSALTYARRYALGALVGLTSDDDDDGNAATNGTNGSGKTAQPSQQARKKAPPKSTPPAAAASATNTSAPAALPTTNGSNGAAGNGQARWASPAEAHAWAVEAGACATLYEAQGSFGKIVRDSFGNKLTRENMAAALDAFYARQMEKLHAIADAAAQDAPELNPDALETA